MHRRQFLTLLGGGAVGGAALAGSALSGPEPDVDEEDDDEIESPTSGLQRIVWSVDTAVPRAALTFDDGPDPEFTPEILEILGRYGVKSTFMVMGFNAVQYPDLINDIVAAGHEIGSHSWSHRNLAKATAAETRTEIEYGARVVEDIAGVPVRFFRPPRGRLSESAVRVLAFLRHDVVLWSLTRGELSWDRPDRVASHVVESISRGDIIDFHDGIGRGTFNRGTEAADELRHRRAVEIEALPSILEGVRDRGLHLTTVSELLRSRAADDLAGQEGPA